jgi:hypothetical protein
MPMGTHSVAGVITVALRGRRAVVLTAAPATRRKTYLRQQQWQAEARQQSHHQQVGECPAHKPGNFTTSQATVMLPA